MWNRIGRQPGDCGSFRTSLEDYAVATPGPGTVEGLLESMPPMTRTHFAACPECRQVARDLLTAREVLKRAAPEGFEPGPWFAGRVMAAIAMREKELEEAAHTWLVVPRFASRVALASGALLLIASTWLYKRPSAERPSQPAAVAAPEYLFEAPAPPMNQDDVLISMAERNP